MIPPVSSARCFSSNFIECLRIAGETSQYAQIENLAPAARTYLAKRTQIIIDAHWAIPAGSASEDASGVVACDDLKHRAQSVFGQLGAKVSLRID
jgi:hypothetical protein